MFNQPPGQMLDTAAASRSDRHPAARTARHYRSPPAAASSRPSAAACEVQNRTAGMGAERVLKKVRPPFPTPSRNFPDQRKIGPGQVLIAMISWNSDRGVDSRRYAGSSGPGSRVPRGSPRKNLKLQQAAIPRPLSESTVRRRYTAPAVCGFVPAARFRRRNHRFLKGTHRPNQTDLPNIADQSKNSRFRTKPAERVRPGFARAASNSLRDLTRTPRWDRDLGIPHPAGAGIPAR